MNHLPSIDFQVLHEFQWRVWLNMFSCVDNHQTFKKFGWFCHWKNPKTSVVSHRLHTATPAEVGAAGSRTWPNNYHSRDMSNVNPKLCNKHTPVVTPVTIIYQWLSYIIPPLQCTLAWLFWVPTHPLMKQSKGDDMWPVSGEKWASDVQVDS